MTMSNKIDHMDWGPVGPNTHTGFGTHNNAAALSSASAGFCLAAGCAGITAAVTGLTIGAP